MLTDQYDEFVVDYDASTEAQVLHHVDSLIGRVLVARYRGHELTAIRADLVYERDHLLHLIQGP